MRRQREYQTTGYAVLMKLREAVAYYRPLLEQVRCDDPEALERMVEDFRIVFYFGVLEQVLRRIGLPNTADVDAWAYDPDRDLPFRLFQKQLLQSYPRQLAPLLKERLNEAEVARHWFAHPSPDKSPPVPKEREKASHNLGSVVLDLLQRLEEWTASEQWEKDLITSDATKVPELFYEFLSANTRLRPRSTIQPEAQPAEKQ
jgi:hypothetical protein